MGKTIVVKGADFSANGMTIIPAVHWYVDECTASPSSGSLLAANLANGGWVYSGNYDVLLRGKIVSRIKLIPSQAGTFNIYTTESSLSGAVTLRASITIDAADIGRETVYSFQEFSIPENGYIVFGEANSVGGFYYVGGGAGYSGFYSKVPSNPTSTGTTAKVNISIGYYGI